MELESSSMTELEEVRGWLLATVRLIVDRPEDASATFESSLDGATFQIHVDPSDLGKVIGRQGRAAQSLRVLAGGMANKLGRSKFTLEVADQKELSQSVPPARSAS